VDERYCVSNLRNQILIFEIEVNQDSSDREEHYSPGFPGLKKRA